MKSNIIIRLEGGLGDCICGHRFSYAVKEKYPNADLYAYIRANDFDLVKKTFDYCWPDFYKNIVSVYGGDTNIRTNFGEESWNSARESDWKEFQEDYENELFFDFHIDRMEWPNYNLPLYKYINHFPTPPWSLHDKKKLITVQLDSAISSGHKLEPNKIEDIIISLCEIRDVIVICTEENEHLYKHLPCHILKSNDFTQIIEIIDRSELLVCVDSGLKYIGLCCNVMTLCFSENCKENGVCSPAHEARWLINPKHHFPIDCSVDKFIRCVNRVLTDKCYYFWPDVYNAEFQLIRRKIL